MCPQPGGEGLFGDIASGNSEHGDHTRCIVSVKPPAIEPQKQFGRHIARSLVSINKRMNTYKFVVKICGYKYRMYFFFLHLPVLYHKILHLLLY